MIIEQKLEELGLELPHPPKPLANYLPSVHIGDLLYIGGVICTFNEELMFEGKVGAEVSVEEAYQAAQICALNHLAIVKQALGDLDRVERVVKVQGFGNSAPGFHEQSRCINGESDLLEKLYGDKGRHARSVVGVSELVRNASVETDILLQIKS